jgi:hypothetical protein
VKGFHKRSFNEARALAGGMTTTVILGGKKLQLELEKKSQFSCI